MMPHKQEGEKDQHTQRIPRQHKRDLLHPQKGILNNIERKLLE